MHKLDQDPIIRVLNRHIFRFYFSHMAPWSVYKTISFILNHWNIVSYLELIFFFSRSAYIAHTHMHA